MNIKETIDGLAGKISAREASGADCSKQLRRLDRLMRQAAKIGVAVANFNSDAAALSADIDAAQATSEAPTGKVTRLDAEPGSMGAQG